MKRVRGGAQGFTIIETMIFLVVSAALLISAMVLIGGKQRKTEFTQAIDQFESIIKDQLNDIATGYYPSANNVSCVSSGSTSPTELKVASGADQGTNQSCIFVGKVFQFWPDGLESHTMRVYTTAGKRLYSNRDVQNLKEAKPCLLAQGAASTRCGSGGGMYPNQFDTVTFSPAISIKDDPSKTSTFGFGVFTTLRNNNVLDPDNLAADIIMFTGTHAKDPQQTQAIFVDEVTASLQGSTGAVLNPLDGIKFCLVSEGTDESALFVIGAQQGGVSTRIDRFNNKDCT